MVMRGVRMMKLNINTHYTLYIHTLYTHIFTL